MSSQAVRPSHPRKTKRFLVIPDSDYNCSRMPLKTTIVAAMYRCCGFRRYYQIQLAVTFSNMIIWLNDKNHGSHLQHTRDNFKLYQHAEHNNKYKHGPKFTKKCSWQWNVMSLSLSQKCYCFFFVGKVNSNLPHTE